MITDGYAHNLEYFENIAAYQQIDVTAETFEAEKADGLYSCVNALVVPDDAARITLIYRDPSYGVIDTKTVQVINDGEQGGAYIGCYSVADPSTEDPAAEKSFVFGDFFLNSADGYIYFYKNRKWHKVSDYTDVRYKQAINDMISIASSSSSTEFMSVVNLWCQNLVAQTALINQLFAKQINLQSGGYIQSENYGNVNQPRFQYWNGTDWQDDYTTYDATLEYSYIKIRVSGNNGDDWTTFDPLTISTDGSDLYLPYVYYRTSAEELDDSDDGATADYTELTLGNSITVSEDKRSLKFHVLQEVNDSESEDSEWFIVVKLDKGGFRLSYSGTMQSGNYDEENLLGYRLGADGIFRCNNGIFQNANVKGAFLAENGFYYNYEIYENSWKDFLQKLWAYVVKPAYYNGYNKKLINGIMQLYDSTNSVDIVIDLQSLTMDWSSSSEYVYSTLSGNISMTSAAGVSFKGNCTLNTFFYWNGNNPTGSLMATIYSAGEKQERTYTADYSSHDFVFKWCHIVC